MFRIDVVTVTVTFIDSESYCNSILNILNLNLPDGIFFTILNLI